MNKKVFFYIDDVIWVFRDLTRQRPKSIFDHHFLKPLKEAHDKYGAKVQLNAFYRTDFFYGNDEFTLADMTDAYKAEWENASDWLKIGFHSKQEFPDYPLVNISYQDAKDIFQSIYREVCRFAGENSMAWAVEPHWLPVSKEGCRALRDCGIRLISTTIGASSEYNGDPASLPYGHAGRLLQNRQPETKVFLRGTRNTAIDNSLCAYNHFEPDMTHRMMNTTETIYDPDLDVYFKRLGGGSCLNLIPMEDLAAELGQYLENEFVGLGTHEQYSYPDYFSYQPDHGDRILEACRLLAQKGFTFIFAEELVVED